MFSFNPKELTVIFFILISVFTSSIILYIKSKNPYFAKDLKLPSSKNNEVSSIDTLDRRQTISTQKDGTVIDSSSLKKSELSISLNNKEISIDDKATEPSLISQHTPAPSKSPQLKPLVDKLDINTITVKKLALLPGIKEDLANNIINFRNQKGKIKSMEELYQVSGVDDKVFKWLNRFLEVKE